MQDLANTRLIFFEQAGTLEIRFSALRWGWWLFLTVVIAISTIVGALIFGASATIDGIVGNGLPWLWLVIEAVLVLNWLWLLFGSETLIVKRSTLVFQRNLFGYGKTVKADVAKAATIRLAGFFEGFGAWTPINQLRRALVFYADGNKYLFGMMLKTEEARLVVARVKAHLRNIS